MQESLVEVNFDGLVGPTHTHAGLSPGNLASVHNFGGVSNPRQSALQGLAKMRRVWELGIRQAILPPHERPLLSALEQLGLGDPDRRDASERHAEKTYIQDLLNAAKAGTGQLLQLCSSSSAMWTANAATVAPGRDTKDGRLHLTVANLSHMFHRSLEAPTTERVLRKVFADPQRFAVHSPVPPGSAFADEGAANHTRLATDTGVVHLFAWGRSHYQPLSATPCLHPARQTVEASRAVARLNALSARHTLLWQQSPEGIDAGAFHTDVLAVGNDHFFLLHEKAFVEHERLLSQLRARLGESFCYRVVTETELPVDKAVAAYPFNCQLLTLPDNSMAILAPQQAERCPQTRKFFSQLLTEQTPVRQVLYSDVTGSMKNGGGPACLRLRVPLSHDEIGAITPRVFLDEPLFADLTQWIETHYRDRLDLSDLADPNLLLETRDALDELTSILRLGSVYDFQN